MEKFPTKFNQQKEEKLRTLPQKHRGISKSQPNLKETIIEDFPKNLQE
jgi:hypothetical protein